MLGIIDTPIGDVIEPALKYSDCEYKGARAAPDNVYFDRKNKFVIRWPKDSGWEAENQPVFVLCKLQTPRSSGEAAVYVDAYSAGNYDGNLAVLAAAIINSARLGGVVITTVDVDNSNGGAVIVSRKSDDGVDLHGVHKLVLNGDHMYNMFSALLPSAANDERLRMEINGILNSFETVDVQRE